MRKALLLPFLFVWVILGTACTSTGSLPNIGTIFKAATTQIQLPVEEVNIYQVKLGYDLAQGGIIEYQERCFGPFDPVTQQVRVTVTVAQIRADSTLSWLCKNRVSRYKTMKRYEAKTYATIIAAEQFIRDNPTGNAISYIRAAVKALADFKQALPAKS